MARKKATRKHTAKKHTAKKRGPKKGAPTLLGLNSRVNKIENRVELLMGGSAIPSFTRRPASSKGKGSGYSPLDEGVEYDT